MSTTIRIKKSGTPGNVPLSTALSFGELAINYADGVLWYKNANGTVTPLTTGGGGGNAWSTISANGTLLIPDTNVSILTLYAGSALSLVGNAYTDGITFSVKTNDTVESNSTDQVATANVANTLYGIATYALNTANNALAAANTALANASITVKEVYSSNANVVNAFSGIHTIQFDAESDFAVVDESNNTVTIKMNSTFKYWQMNGVPTLEAVGQDTINFLTDGNVTVEANNANTPFKTISFAVPEFGNLYSKTNSAYGQANTALLVAEDAYDQANAAYNAANNAQITVYANNGSGITTQNLNFINTSAVVVSVTSDPNGNANIAFSASLAGIASSFQSDVFIANGSCTVYQLAQTVADQDSVFVYLDGVSQVPSIDYAASGNSITFLTAPDNLSVIEIRTITAAPSIPPSVALSNNFAGLSLTANSLNFSVGNFSALDDSISKSYILRGITSSNTESELLINGASRIPVKANTTIFYTADIVGRRTDANNESCGIQLKGVVDNFSGTVADVGNLYELIVAEDSPAVQVDMRADNSNDSINIYVTGETGKTIRWTALIRTVEVSQ